MTQLERPKWLPEIISVRGDWEDILRRLYRIFSRDFRRDRCHYEGKPVWWDRRKLDDSPYEEGFWHLITKLDRELGDRLLDPRRAERLTWCKPTIENSRDALVTVWRYRESSGRVRTYVWLVDWDYVVILEEREHRGGREVAFLVTAFYVEGNRTRRNLQRKHRQRIV